MEDSSSSEHEGSDAEILGEKGGMNFFDGLGDAFVPPSWDVSSVIESASIGARGSTKSLVSDLIKDSLSRRGKKSKESRREDDDDDEDATARDSSVGAKADVGEGKSRDDSDDSEEDEVRRKRKNVFFEQPPPQVQTATFMDMNLSRPLLKAIGTLGFSRPTPVQASAIPIALAGKDICACAATGTGKTAAFLLPIMERLLFRPNEVMTRVLILLPTRELAIQVHAVASAIAKHTSITVCLAAGGLDRRQQEAALRQVPDIVIATPGRLIDHLHNALSFSLTGVEILVLDEADRMLQENFEEQLHEILKLCYRGRQTMLFSATMTDEVEDLVALSLNQPVRLFMNSNTQVAARLEQEFVRVRSHRESKRPAIIAALCCRSFPDHVIIFVPTKVLAHRLRIQLGLLGLNVDELHGDLTQLQRLENLEKFKKSEVDFLVATDLAARGLDIAGVQTVINYSMPSNVKQYVHRVGRTARAGHGGRSVTLIGEKERKVLKQIVKQASQSVKARVVGANTIDKFAKRLDGIEAELKSILKAEAEEKEVRIAEMEVGKAQNIIEHRDEIYSRPKRTFINSGRTGSAQARPNRQKRGGGRPKSAI